MSSPNDLILTKAGLIGNRQEIVTSFLSSFETTLSSGNKFGPPELHFQGVGPESAKNISEKLALPSSNGWKSIFIDSIVMKLGDSLNLPGSTPLLTPPVSFIFDISSLLPESKIDFPISNPNPLNLTNWIFSSLLKLEKIESFIPSDPRIAQASLALTDLLKTSGIQIPPPFPKIPQIPTFDIPSLPGYSQIPKIPNEFYPAEFLTGILSIPVSIFSQYFTNVEKMASLITNIKNFPKLIVDEITNMIMSIPLVDKLLKKNPKPISFIGSLIEIIKFISSIVSSTLIGSIMGAGSLSKKISNLVLDLF